MLLQQVSENKGQTKAKRLWVWAFRRIKNLKGKEIRPQTGNFKLNCADHSSDEDDPI